MSASLLGGQPGHIQLLARLIATPSHSREEHATAGIIYDYLAAQGMKPRRTANNVYAVAPGFDRHRSTLLLNSHHDTVRPAAGYTREPYTPVLENGAIYGLGANDAGASVVSLTAVFGSLRHAALPFNLVLAISAEEEVGGENGMRALLPHLASEGITPDCAIVGEPTGMRAAVAERGLVVLDAVTRGISGHAARGEGANAIYRAMSDIDALRSFAFTERSETLGDISLSVTQISAGKAHNVVPDECRWVADVRTTDAYSNEDTIALLRKAVSSHTTLTERSTRVRASVIGHEHPLVQACERLGIESFVSPTTSDMSLMHGFPSLKIGPGESCRSHTADEYVLLSEIEGAIEIYGKIITSLSL